jgi:hypothetical protein
MIRRENGVVLTFVNNLDQLEDCVRRGGYDTVKVITGWGVDEGGWSAANKTRVLNMVPNVIVRTVAGDPSTGTPGTNDYLKVEQVEQELTEWYRIKPDIIIELGNEPNIKNTDDDFFWKYRYFLAASVAHCRSKFPKVRLISPAPIIGPNYNHRRFWEINRDAMSDCDFIGIHAYEYYGFHASHQLAATNQLKEAIEICQQLFNHRPWYITEYGVNDSKQVTVEEKGRRYAQMVHHHMSHPPLPGNVKGAVYYHIGMKGDLHPEYHLYPDGDSAYRQVRDGGDAAQSFALSFEPMTVSTAPIETVSSIVEPFLPQISEMIAALVEWEHEAVVKRAEDMRDSLKNTSPIDYIELHRVQALRAVLEVALNCMRDDSTLAQQLMMGAMSQITAWNEQVE